MTRYLSARGAMFGLLLGWAAACSDDGDDLTPVSDAGVEIPEVGPQDLGPEPDGGPTTTDGGTPTEAGTGDGSTSMDAGLIDPQSEPFRTLNSQSLPAGPSDQRIDLVFVGDGYPIEELGTSYRQHVEHVANRIFTPRANGATEPFYQFRRVFNVHRVHLASNESGIDDPSTSTMRDTALDGTAACSNLVGAICYVDTAKAKAAVDRALSGSSIVPDLIIITLNTDQPLEHAVVNSDGRFAIYGGGPTDGLSVNTSERGLRQMARAFADLSLNDPGMGPYVGAEPSSPNLTTSSTGAKWSRWVGFNAANDGQAMVGASEGGGGFATGVYRPVMASKLTGDYPGPFDPVAREAIVLKFFEILPLITFRSDNASTMMNPVRIIADELNEAHVSIRWFVNGMDTMTTGDTFGFAGWASANGLLAGRYQVEARATAVTRYRFPVCRNCQSRTIDFVREPSPHLSEAARWMVIYSP